MQIDCPHDFKQSFKIGKNTAWEDTTVNIQAGICDCADLCGKSHCLFYDLSQKGTRDFLKMSAHEETLEGFLEGQQHHITLNSRPQ